LLDFLFLFIFCIFMSTISFWTNKGGVGKTTTLLHCANDLCSDHNKKVLVIDFDSQLNTTLFLMEYYFKRKLENSQNFINSNYENKRNLLNGINIYIDNYIDNVSTTNVYNQDNNLNNNENKLINHNVDIKSLWYYFINIQGNDNNIDIRDYIIEIKENLFLIKGSLMINELEPIISLAINTPNMIANPNRTISNFKLLFDFLLLQGFDKILLDLSPSSSILNQNIIMSSMFMIMPVNLDSYSRMALTTISRWLSDWRNKFNVCFNNLKFLGIIFNEYKKYGGIDNNVATHFKIKISITICKEMLGINGNLNNQTLNQLQNNGLIRNINHDFYQFLIQNIDYLKFWSIPDMGAISSVIQTRYKTCREIDYNFDGRYALGYAITSTQRTLMNNVSQSYSDLTIHIRDNTD